jgi:hypothetical protein
LFLQNEQIWFGGEGDGKEQVSDQNLQHHQISIVDKLDLRNLDVFWSSASSFAFGRLRSLGSKKNASKRSAARAIKIAFFSREYSSYVRLGSVYELAATSE